MNSPFSRQIDPSFLYQSKGHKEALARLQLMVESSNLGVLTGEVGSGKSTLIRSLFQNLDAKRHFPIYITMTGLKPRDFYGELLRHVGEV
jgi:type II secretory pathway predicted ATPase ExeA